MDLVYMIRSGSLGGSVCSACRVDLDASDFDL